MISFSVKRLEFHVSFISLVQFHCNVYLHRQEAPN